MNTMEQQEQQENLERVSECIGQPILDFFNNNGTGAQFHACELHGYVGGRTGQLAPASADRVMRDLRKKKLLNYRIVNRKKSLYEILDLETV